jgi:oligopeptide transport system substrate-binding protein
MFRLLVIPAALIALFGAAMAWSGGGITQRAEFAFINRGDIYTLDLNQMSYMQDFRLTYGIREGLYAPQSGTLKPIPAGAIGHEVTPDGRQWTFHLRPNAKWNNGDPVTARDYVFSWRRMLEEPGEYTYLFYKIRNAKEYEDSYAAGHPIDFNTVGIKALDDSTLQVTLVDPLPYLLELVAFPIFYPRNEKSMEPFKVVQPDGKYTYRNEYTRPAKHAGEPGVVTNGPFDLVRWDFKRRLVLKKSQTYWDKANVKSGSLEMVVNDDPLSQFLQYETRQVDWQSDVPGDLAAQLREQNRQDLRSSPAFATAFITFMCRPAYPQSFSGTGTNPLSDMRVRQALAMAIDKSVITRDVTRMGELVARTYLPPDGTLPDFRWLPGPYDTVHPAAYSDKEVRDLLSKDAAIPGPGLPYDVKRARALLAEAGYPDGKGFPQLPILYNSDSTTRRQMVQVLKNQWKEALNIDVNIETVEGKIYKQRVSKKDYVIGLAAWYGDYPDMSTFTDKYLSDSLQNDSDWQNKEFDDLCLQATKQADPAKRVELLGKAENLIDTEVPIVPVYHYVNVSLSRDNVHGVTPNPRNVTIFKDVWVQK